MCNWGNNCYAVKLHENCMLGYCTMLPHSYPMTGFEMPLSSQLLKVTCLNYDLLPE